MSTATTTLPLAGTYKADPIHSSFGFAVKHMGVSTFRGTFSDVEATLADGVLEGRAKVESISIVSPADFRAHVLGADFFDAGRHPEVLFRSTSVDLADDGTATVRGELTIKGITREVVATGTWTPPAESPYGIEIAALELATELDRTQFGMTWNAPLPKGGNILDEKVTLTVHLELQAQA
jgi:polyisoprenoid-binding protein YceI